MTVHQLVAVLSAMSSQGATVQVRDGDSVKDVVAVMVIARSSDPQQSVTLHVEGGPQES